ncbi:translation elongation factor 2 [Rhodocollybia butyracea]|uniref:Translation elongation factor 2 n=1 Tax=Rhodocollybia butyracea TaxID=206335 RepID=A0A9P5Q9I8_9AGAR|nr:translation elongation factor 2 [Rhodocollybia butyracea]
MQTRLWSIFSAKCPAISRAISTRSVPHDPSKIRNMALVAHIDSGKTTLTESILLQSSYLSASGSVDTGSTTTDFLPAERERGITIQSASIPVKWKDWTFNLIDTPGHADFGMEVESASRVIDGAVVLIDSVEGVEAQTKGVWRQLDRYGVPTRMMFLNKQDRPGASFRSSLRSLLTHRFHPHPMVLTLPIASFDPQDYAHGEPGIQGLVDLAKWELWRWNKDGESTCHPLPTDIKALEKLSVLPSNHPIIPHLAPARTQLLENLSMFSEELMEVLLASEPSSYLGIKYSEIIPHLRKSTLENKILPVVCGSALKHIGTNIVMDYVGELLATPLDVLHDPTRNAPLRMLAWKVSWDPRRGWMTYVRIYSGKLSKQSSVLNATRNQKEKISKLLLMYAAEPVEVDELPFGSVGVVLGLKFTRTGDTLVSPGAPSSSRSTMQDIVPPKAVISASVIPNSHADLEPVQTALESLARTDPSVRYDLQEGQILVHGLGALHLEIVEGRLRDEFHANFELGKRRVSYREALGPNYDLPHFEKPLITDSDRAEIAGTLVDVALDIRPLRDDEEGNPLWDGNLILNEAGVPIASPETSSTANPELLIASGIASTLSSSPHSSLPLSHLRIQIRAWSLPSPMSLLAGASAIVLRNRIRKAGMGPLMEPYFMFKVTVTEDTLGKVVKDLTEHGAELQDLGDGMSEVGEVGGYPEDGNYIPPEMLSPSSSGSALKGSGAAPKLKRSIRALAPLSRMLDYNSRLRALSGGHGQFDMASAGFRVVAETRKMEILREIGKA